MKKETIVAIGAGFLLGFIVAFSFINLPSITKNGLKFSWKLPSVSLNFAQNTPAYTPPPTPSPVQSFTVTFPINESISFSKSITIKGKAPLGAVIIISTSASDTVTKAGKDGSYSANITLSEGANNILVSSFLDKNQIPYMKNILVSYTSEKF